jgi:6-phosphogluconolactonase
MLLVLTALAACGSEGGGDVRPGISNPPPPAGTFTVGGTVSGLTGSGLVLQNNGGDPLAISADGAFIFASPLADGASYNVTVRTQPTSPAQTCIVKGGAGTVAGANVTGVTIVCSTSTARFAYVANFTSNDISAYTIDATSGALTPVTGPFLTGINPNSIAIDPTGNFAYVTNNGGDVSAYVIDPGSGALTPVTGSPFVTGLNPNAIAIDPTGNFAYVANFTSNAISAYTINAATGVLTPVTGLFSTGLNPNAIAIDPTGKFVYVTNNGGDVSAYVIDRPSGALIPVTGGPFVTGLNPNAIAIDPAGKFVYVTNKFDGVSAYTIDATSGALTPLTGTFVAGTNPNAIATVNIP